LNANIDEQSSYTKNTEKYAQKANEIVLEHTTEVEEMWKLDRGMGVYSPVPVAHIKIIMFLFCPNLSQNLNIKATSNTLPRENTLRRRAGAPGQGQHISCSAFIPGACFHLR